MGDSRREEFVKRLSTVGLGTRESIQIMLGGIICDIRQHATHKKFSDEEMDAVIAFHDEAEALWQDSIGSNPPLGPQELTARLRRLLKRCTGSLGEFESKLARAVDHAEQFDRKTGGD
jgi:hypothetical protein